MISGPKNINATSHKRCKTQKKSTAEEAAGEDPPSKGLNTPDAAQWEAKS